MLTFMATVVDSCIVTAARDVQPHGMHSSMVQFQLKVFFTPAGPPDDTVPPDITQGMGPN